MGPIFSLILTLIKVFGWGNCLSLTLNEWQLAGLQPVYVLLSVTKLHGLDRGACECTTLQTVVLNPKHRGWVRDTIGKTPPHAYDSQSAQQSVIHRPTGNRQEWRQNEMKWIVTDWTDWMNFHVEMNVEPDLPTLTHSEWDSSHCIAPSKIRLQSRARS